MSKIGVCSLCDTKNVQLVHGHIIPKQFFSQNTHIITKTEKKPSMVSGKGPRAYFSCLKCDTGVLAKYDEQAYQFFRDQKYSTIEENKEFLLIEYPIEQQKLLAKFCLSVVWRAIHIDKKLSLGPYYEIIKSTILNIDSPIPSSLNYIYFKKLTDVPDLTKFGCSSKDKIITPPSKARSKE